MSVCDNMNEVRSLRHAFGKCSTSSYKQRGLRRVLDAERFLVKNYDYALKLIAEARYELQYAQEYTQIQNLRGGL